MRVSLWVIAAALCSSTAALADAPIGVGNIKTEVKKKSGAEKDKKWVKFSVTATVNQKLDKFQGLKIKLTCKDGETTVTDEAASSSAKLYDLEVGKTKDVEFRMFFDKGKALPGGACTVAFGHGKTTKKEEFTTLSEHCLEGATVKDGACP